nr:non-structural protein NS4b [Rio Bravo virus]
NEMRLLENTKRDIMDLFKRDTTVNESPVFHYTWESLMEWDIRPLTIWATYVVFVTLARPQALHNLKMFTQRVITGTVAGKHDMVNLLPFGAAWLSLGLGDLTLAVGAFRNMSCLTLVGGVLLALAHWTWFYPLHAAAESSKAHKIVTQSLSKNTMVDGETIYQLDQTSAETERSEKIFSMVTGFTLTAINVFTLRKAWAVLECVMVGMVLIKYLIEPKGTTFWTLPVVSGLTSLVRGDFFGLIPISFRVWLYARSDRR